jgi:hypothetical protein
MKLRIGVVLVAVLGLGNPWTLKKFTTAVAGASNASVEIAETDFARLSPAALVQK